MPQKRNWVDLSGKKVGNGLRRYSATEGSAV